MNKTIKIILYVAFLLFAYFAVTAIYKSCTSSNNASIVDNEDDNITSDEEDDFFKDFDSDDEVSDETESNTDNDDEYVVEEEIDYEALDNKLTGTNDEVVESPNVEEIVPSKATPVTSPSRVTNYTDNSGKYLVVAGSFLVENNANRLVVKLKKMGYNNAEIVMFDDSRFYTVVARRSNSRSEARNSVTSMKNKGVDCYLHTKK